MNILKFGAKIQKYEDKRKAQTATFPTHILCFGAKIQICSLSLELYKMRLSTNSQIAIQIHLQRSSFRKLLCGYSSMN